jgi:membrane protein
MLQIVNAVVSLTMSAITFAMIYRFMPHARIAWRDVWIGAAVTAVLFEAGKFLIGLYIGETGVASGFGAAGSLVVLIVWVYYSAQIFLLGAEFTWVYARSHGSRRGADTNATAPIATIPDKTSPAPRPDRRSAAQAGS